MSAAADQIKQQATPAIRSNLFANVPNDSGDELNGGKENRDRKQQASASLGENTKQQQSLCFGCKRSLAISPQLINIDGHANKWHPECFKCQICHLPMDKNVSCHIYKDKIVCRNDYLRLQHDNSIKCARCKWPIAPSDWVRKAANYVYHLACFNCDICLRQLNTGEQFTINVQDKNNDVRLLCRLHFAVNTSNEQLPIGTNHATKTTAYSVQDQNGCNRPSISHESTSRDTTGNVVGTHSLASQRSFVRPFQADNQFERAALLNQFMHSNETNESSSIDEQQQQHLTTNKIRNERLEDTQTSHQEMFANESSLLDMNKSNMYDDSVQVVHRTLGTNGASSANKQTSSCKKSLHAHRTGSNSTANNMSPSNGSPLGSIQSKSKRVRTTFTEDQLAILQTQFQLDSNPDGQDLERIATITALSKRVTQVWFQNSRARQKKYMIKRKPSSSSTAATSIATPTTSPNSGQTSGGSANMTQIGSRLPIECQLNHTGTVVGQSLSMFENETQSANVNKQTQESCQATNVANVLPTSKWISQNFGGCRFDSSLEHNRQKSGNSASDDQIAISSSDEDISRSDSSQSSQNEYHNDSGPEGSRVDV